MKADFAWWCGGDLPPGGYSTVAAIRLLPGMLAIASLKAGVTLPGGSAAIAAEVSTSAGAARQATMSVNERRCMMVSLWGGLAQRNPPLHREQNGGLRLR